MTRTQQLALLLICAGGFILSGELLLTVHNVNQILKRLDVIEKIVYPQETETTR